MATKISNFDADAFLGTEFTGTNATKVIPVPEMELRAIVEKVGLRGLQTDDGPLFFLDVTWKIDDPDGIVKDVTKRDKNTVRQGVRLDILMGRDGQPKLDPDPNLNVGLGRLRQAIGQNYSDRPWTFGMLTGGMATIQVKHRTDKDSGDTFAEVGKVIAVV